MPDAITLNYDRKLYKKCIKCRGWHLRVDLLDEDGKVTAKRRFGKHKDSSDGLASICMTCKGNRSKVTRNKNVRARLRHHIATRCLTQLGKAAPENFTRDLEVYLNYKMQNLVAALRKDLHAREGVGRKLRDALDEGYHIDHIRPLSLYEVVTPKVSADATLDAPVGDIDWKVFQECWAIKNLSAIPGSENLAKGASYAEPEEEPANEEPVQAMQGSQDEDG